MGYSRTRDTEMKWSYCSDLGKKRQAPKLSSGYVIKVEEGSQRKLGDRINSLW